MSKSKIIKIIKKKNVLSYQQWGMLFMLLALLIGFGAQESFAASTTFHDNANSLNSSAIDNLQSQANGLPLDLTSLTNLANLGITYNPIAGSLNPVGDNIFKNNDWQGGISNILNQARSYTSASSRTTSPSYLRRTPVPSRPPASRRSSGSGSTGFPVFGCLVIAIIAIVSFILFATGRLNTTTTTTSSSVTVDLISGVIGLLDSTSGSGNWDNNSSFSDSNDSGSSDWGGSSGSFSSGGSDWGSGGDSGGGSNW